MKTTFIYLALLFLISINTAKAQQENSLNYLTSLPTDLVLDKSVKRSYKMITDYYNYDLKSNFLNKERYIGSITYTGDSAQWKDVYHAKSKVLDAVYPQGEKKEFLQEFKYKQDEKVLSTDFFMNYLPEADTFIMNLIWDALAFDNFAYCCWDSLKLGKEYQAKSMNSEMQIADIGTFENNDIRITWLGITKIGDEICAILKYSVMNNPVNVNFENISMSGRSHYWGEIYVSLSDKQIEQVNLMEDVVTDTNIKGQADNILGYTVRTISFSRTE